MADSFVRDDSSSELDQVVVESDRHDLSDEDHEASLGGVRLPQERPPADHIRSVAHAILWIFGASMMLILLLTTAVACWRESALKDVIAFFATVVATMGTLLGGVIAFYFARR